MCDRSRTTTWWLFGPTADRLEGTDNHRLERPGRCWPLSRAVRRTSDEGSGIVAAKTESGERWERSPGYVYFIGVGVPPQAVKIGISTQRDIGRRLSTLQGGNHEPLTLLGVIPFEAGERPMLEAARHEAELHERFASAQRFRKGWAGSEWFTASPELFTLIAEQAVPPSARGLPSSIAKPGPGRP